MDIYKYVNITENTVTTGIYTIDPHDAYISNSTIPELDRLDGITVDKYVNGVAVQEPIEFNYINLILSEEQNTGIRLDVDNPDFGWNDLLSTTIVYSGAASNKPVFTTLVGTIKEYQFLLNDESYHEFHLPHDYAPGTDLYIHVHWTHNSGSVTSGSVTWQVDATYAKGYGRGVFNSPVAIPIVEVAPTVALTHMISEVKLSTPGGTGGLLDTDLIEADGVIKARLKLITNSMSAATDPFVHYCDIHYQSTGLPTKNRNFDFWAK